MRKTNVTESRLRDQDIKEFTNTRSATDGLRKSKAQDEDTTLAASKSLTKQSPQERKSLKASTVNSRVKLELVRPGRSPPSTPPASAHSDAATRPDLTSQVEQFHEIARELPPLFERHYREIAVDQDTIPLDPDWDRYFMLALNGMLIVRTARFDTTLVGYIFNLVGPHLHYRSTPHAEIEMFWLDPAYRGSSFAIRWFRENEAYLRELGIKKIGVATKNGYKDGRVGLIFKRLGYLSVETVWSKVL